MNTQARIQKAVERLYRSAPNDAPIRGIEAEVLVEAVAEKATSGLDALVVFMETAADLLVRSDEECADKQAEAAAATFVTRALVRYCIPYIQYAETLQVRLEEAKEALNAAAVSSSEGAEEIAEFEKVLEAMESHKAVLTEIFAVAVATPRQLHNRKQAKGAWSALLWGVNAGWGDLLGMEPERR